MIRKFFVRPTQPSTQPMGNELRKKLRIKSSRFGSTTIEDNDGESRRRGILQYVQSSTTLHWHDSDSPMDYGKTSLEREIIRSAFKNDDFFDGIIGSNEATIEEIINCMYAKRVYDGHTVIQEGQSDTHMYISARGTFEIVQEDTLISTFNDVRLFGELAVLYNAPVMATVRAKGNCKYWVLEQTDFKRIVMQSALDQRSEKIAFLSKIPKLSIIGEDQVGTVADLLKLEFFETGTEIITEGDKGDKFYIIRAGSVTITKKKTGVVDKLYKGHFFGELALLEEVGRQATVTADAPGVECLTLTKKEFIEHFGEVPNMYAINIQKSPYNIMETIEELPDLKLEDLTRIATLGVGGFGRVELVQHSIRRNRVFALKSLKKQKIVALKQQEHVLDEKNNQISCRCRFIVRLYRTFKDPKYVYFLLEACLGGDLWSLQRKQKRKQFEESAARFYAACVLEALTYLHDRSIIFRDLKPENLMVDWTGYLKLGDFGFTKKLERAKKTFSFVGTPEYLTPEVIMSKGHDKAVDYWALGVLIYEMLAGKTPFRTNDNNYKLTYKLILMGFDQVKFPEKFPSAAKFLVRKLCKTRPAERLGCLRRGAKDVKGHIWFSHIDWIRLNNGALPAPYVPTLKSKTDTRYSEDFPDELEDRDEPQDDMSSWDEQF